MTTATHTKVYHDTVDKIIHDADLLTHWRKANHEDYEHHKARIAKLNLDTAAYEGAIKRLVAALEL
jgi:hypothetical protein